MRGLPVLLLLSACAPARLAAVEPVVFQASLQAGAVEAGATQGVGGTLVNRSRQPITHWGRGEIAVVRLFRQSERPFRRADAPDDSAAVVGPYWERAYHLAFAPEPGVVRTLELLITVLKPGERRVMQPVRFRWPDDPGVYTVSVCSGYTPGADTSAPGREVCAPSVRVEVRRASP